MERPTLTRWTAGSVTLLGDQACPYGVSFAFTERTGGVSLPPFDSLNLGVKCGDDPATVAENLRRALAALGAEDTQDRLVRPRQVHGDTVVCVTSNDESALAAARAAADAGADAVVCTAPEVPVLLCFADCAPVVLCASGGFAVVHSGRAGSYLGIAGKAARQLAEASGCDVAQIRAYVGPRILGDEYEVSPQIVEEFVERWGSAVRVAGKPRYLAFDRAIVLALEQAGVSPELICAPEISTVSAQDRFFSYRGSGGTTGRHAAIAYLPS